MIRDAGEVYSVQYTKKIGSVYRSVYCIYICILTCYTTLSSINTSRLQYSTVYTSPASLGMIVILSLVPAAVMDVCPDVTMVDRCVW